MVLRPLGELGRFYIYAFSFLFILPIFIMKSYLVSDAIDIALYSSILFLVTFYFSYSFSLKKRKTSLVDSRKIQFENKIQWSNIILFVSITIIFAGIIGTITGTFGARGEKIVSNVNIGVFALLNTLLSPFLDIIAAYFWSRALINKSKLFFLFAAILSGYILGSSGTRWHFLLALSPLILYIVIRLGSVRAVTIGILVFLALLPFSFIRNGEAFSWILILQRMPMEVPAYESVRAIKLIGIHPEGLMGFVHGILYYPIPRFLFDKGFDQTLLDFNWAVLGIDIRYYPATILPGLIGSLYMYGGPLMIGLFGAIFGRAFRYLDRKLFTLINYGSSGFTYASLLFLALFLQVRNLSVGYFVSFIIFSFIWYSLKTGWIVLPKKKKIKVMIILQERYNEKKINRIYKKINKGTLFY
ncbi:MAG: hypothetical protein PHZ17_04620 [Sulfurovum sp.]|nr:hypothetical protein [Sulfurovum sp.]